MYRSKLFYEAFLYIFTRKKDGRDVKAMELSPWNPRNLIVIFRAPQGAVLGARSSVGGIASVRYGPDFMRKGTSPSIGIFKAFFGAHREGAMVLIGPSEIPTMPTAV